MATLYPSFTAAWEAMRGHKGVVIYRWTTRDDRGCVVVEER